jgi:TRAP transporter TAXI family solute receptor
MVLRAFIDGQESWGVRELANALDRPGSSVHRILKGLRQEGLLDWDVATQQYRAGTELHRWAAVLGARMPLARIAAPILTELATTAGESCWLGMYEPTKKSHTYIVDVPGPRAPRHHAQIGQNASLWESAAGLVLMASLASTEQEEVIRPAFRPPYSVDRKALLHSLELARARGYAHHFGTHAEDPVTIAAAIFDSGDQPIGSLTLAMPKYRHQPSEDERLGAMVASQARRLSHLLGSRLLGGGGAGSWHVGAEMIADIIREHVPGIHTSSISGGGDLVIRDLQEGRGAYGLAVAGSLSAAWHGDEPFSEPHDRLRAVCSLFPLFLHVVAHPRHVINSFADLAGLRVSAGQTGYTTAAVFGQLMRLAGLNAQSFRLAGGALIDLDYAEANREFISGTIDVVVSLAGLSDPAYRGIALGSGVQIVPLDEKLVADFLAANKLYKEGEIPSHSYPGTPEAIRTIASPTVLVTTADRSSLEVFEVAKTIFEKRTDLLASASIFGNFGRDTLFQGIDIPLHPGAEKYWREIGVMNCPSSEIMGQPAGLINRGSVSTSRKIGL